MAATNQKVVTSGRSCYDGTMPGVPFLPNEVWQSKRNEEQYSCRCNQDKKKPRTECKQINQSENQQPQCVDKKTGTVRNFNEKWLSSDNQRECACLMDIRGNPTIDCRTKDNIGCVIGGKNIQYLGKTVLNGKTCKCGPRGAVDCFKTCVKQNKSYEPGEITTTKGNDGSQINCKCAPQGFWKCDLVGGNPGKLIKYFDQMIKFGNIQITKIQNSISLHRTWTTTRIRSPIRHQIDQILTWEQNWKVKQKRHHQVDAAEKVITWDPMMSITIMIMNLVILNMMIMINQTKI